ncbi:Sortilin-related receptor [Thelohanellus kitauei]|uniref:Sortilin-related receptor n=1 Tax=Thelohanellus kitauei TaxID=669202 RepID=A0A0C2MYC2_THEKT|nr:Sortilin-related receptor [Thelohanellus kitauei]
MDNLKEIDIQYTESKNGRIPFISYDDGNLWIATTITNSRLVMLKDGMVLVSSHTDTNEINYNVDKGKNTWFRSKLFENQPRVLYIGRLPGEVSTALLITKDVGKNKLIFSSIDFSKILKGECKTRQYESWRFFASGEYCESYRIFDVSTPKPENYCIDKKSHIIGNDVCECTADFYGCTYGYRPWGDACFPDSLMRQIKKPDVCSRETGQKQHELGFIKMDDSQCKPDEAYGVTTRISTEFCAISDYTDFLLLSTDKGMYMYRISARHGGILQKRSVPLDLFLKERVSDPITFDFIRQMTYSLKDKYIDEQPLLSLSQRSIYYFEDVIINMVFEPISHVLIFLTSNKELRALSFLTNLHHLVQIDVAWFKYSHHERLIRFMTTENQLCTCQLFEVPVCNQLDSSYLNAFIYFENFRGVFLTVKNHLKIQKFKNDMKLDESIHKVQDFAVLDNHLFYLSQGKLIYKYLDEQNSDVELDDHQHFRKLDLYRVALQSIILINRFELSVYVRRRQKLPGEMRMPSKHEHLCLGFLCQNKKCFLNNVKCNGISECGDESDEIRCSQKCRENEHLCEMKCISKDIVCEKNSVKYQPKKSILIKTTSVVIFFLVIWVVVMLSVHSYEMKKLRIRRFRPSVPLENPNRSVNGRDSEANNLPDLQGQEEPVMEVIEKVGEFESADA